MRRPRAPASLPVVAVMAAVLGVIHTHRITRQPKPLIVLLGTLMGLVISPYLDSGGAACEVAHGEELTRELLAAPYSPARWRVVEGEQAVKLLEALCDPRAHRARECLLYLARHP